MSTPTKVFLRLQCYECTDSGKTFAQKHGLKRHLEGHGVKFVDRQVGRPPRDDNYDFVKVEEEATLVRYGCPVCTFHDEDLKQVHIHVQKHIDEESRQPQQQQQQQQEEQEHDQDVPDSVDVNESPITVSSKIITPSVPSVMNTSTKQIGRIYEDAIVHACDVKNETITSKRQTIRMVEALNLQPFALMSHQSTEVNALAHPRVVTQLLSNKQFTISSTIPTKRKHDETDAEKTACRNCTPLSDDDVLPLLHSSPYSKLLRQRQYMELSVDICELLDHDLTFFPQTMYVSAQIFAGAILWNTINSKAVLINTIEFYGRRKSVDAHREPFGMKKGTSLMTSVPPPFQTRYSKVWPTTMHTTEGEKLVIGTDVCNLLITSSTRIDQKDIHSVGAITTNFMLPSSQDSLSCRIYLDKASIEKALKFAENATTSRMSNINILSQLRQLKTKYHLASTFRLCRAHGPLTSPHSCQPYTVFTLSDFDGGRNPAASIFSAIATNVLQRGDSATLSKASIKLWASKCADKARTILNDILELDKGSDELTLLGNEELNSKLELLSTLMMPYIVTANKTVQQAVSQRFESFE